MKGLESRKKKKKRKKQPNRSAEVQVVDMSISMFRWIVQVMSDTYRKRIRSAANLSSVIYQWRAVGWGKWARDVVDNFASHASLVTDVTGTAC